MPIDTLLVLELSEVFSDLWPALARELSLRLESVSDPAAITARRDPAMAIVSASGKEPSLESVFRDLSSSPIEVAAVVAEGDHRLAVSLVRAGAAELFVLPQEMDTLRHWLVEQRVGRARHHASPLPVVERRGDVFVEIFGESPLLRAALEQASRIIPHPQVTALLSGETGTGKELLARALHDRSPRAAKPFVDVSCAAFPEALLEVELFGCERGAGDGAEPVSDKSGLFEIANGGTIFLDEIGHLSPRLQGMLLRALDERTIRRVGGTKSIAIDVRVIAATCVDLTRAVRRGDFRQDLFYRLNVVPIAMPPLRRCPDDILPLARRFLARFADEYGLTGASFTPNAERSLRGRSWPGNVRELRRVVERGVLLAHGPMIDAAAIEQESDEMLDGLHAPAHGLNAIIRRAVRETVELCDGNKSDAARRLGISRTRLQRLLAGERRTESPSAVTSPT